MCRDGLGLVCPATVRKAKGASSRTGPKDEADKENVDNGGQASRSKRSMKSNTKSVDNRIDLDVFDPENDAQMHEPQPKVAKTSSGKTGGSKEAATSSKSLSEREKELSKLKVCAYRGCVPPGQTWPSCAFACGCWRADTRVVFAVGNA